MGISTNLDNLLLGLSLGLQKKKLCFWANVLIGFLSAAVTAVFCVLSATLSSLGKLPNVVGGGIIIAVGLWSLLPAHQEASCYQAGFSWRETWMVATGLAVNCIPVAFGAGLTGIPPWAAALSVGGNEPSLCGGRECHRPGGIRTAAAPAAVGGNWRRADDCIGCHRDAVLKTGLWGKFPSCCTKKNKSAVNCNEGWESSCLKDAWEEAKR